MFFSALEALGMKESMQLALPSAKQMPEELRSIIEGGPPEGILSRFCDMFKEKEDATHIRAAEVMQ